MLPPRSLASARGCLLAIIYLFLFKNTPSLEQNAEEMKQDIIVVKLDISKLNKAVFQWTLQ